MLILAAVTITVAMNGGLFQQAQDAVKATDIAQAREQLQEIVVGIQLEKMVNGGIDTDKLDELAEEIKTKHKGLQSCEAAYNDEKGEITITATTEKGYLIEPPIIISNIKTGGGSQKLTVGQTASTTQTLQGGAATYQNPPVPAGFKAVDTTTATWTISGNTITNWNSGLVIEDSIGNQFVWVPVSESVPYAKWTTTNIAYNNSNISDDSLPDEVASEDAQIHKYEGFYIARYEAGLPGDLGGSALTTASAAQRNKGGYAPVSKKNAIPWNYIDYNNSKANAELMYTSTAVKSGLITGTMWDTVARWLENSGKNVQSDSKSWGNYNNAAITGITDYSTNYGASWTNGSTKTAGNSWLLKTGNSDYTQENNISDLAGNAWEWSAEIYSGNRVLRGRRLRRPGHHVSVRVSCQR